MVFRRRDRRPVLQALTELILPRGGWVRAVRYVYHRLRRLPDPPHRVARGVFVGVLISFTPFFGLHFLGAVGLAWLVRGNVLAALLATFFGNPVTLPLIALGSVELGHLIIGGHSGFGFDEIGQSFATAWSTLWHNCVAIFTPATASWGGLWQFVRDIFLPYALGGALLGTLFGILCYYATLPALNAYQRLRDRQRRERAERAAERRRKAEDKERRRAERAAAAGDQ